MLWQCEVRLCCVHLAVRRTRCRFKVSAPRGPLDETREGGEGREGEIPVSASGLVCISLYSLYWIE